MPHVGWDADLVIWDSHPLALGATPIQVIIDGIPQLPARFVVEKPHSFQVVPKVPNFDKEANSTVRQWSFANTFFNLLLTCLSFFRSSTKDCLLWNPMTL